MIVQQIVVKQTCKKRPNLGRYFLFLIFSSFFISESSGQYYQSNLFPYDITSGLPHNEINDIVKDKEGIIWVASENGLSRFDGYNFINFNSTSHPHIFKGNRIRRIEQNNGLLYLLTYDDGLIELNPNTITFKKVYSSIPLSISFSSDTTAILFANGNVVIQKGKRSIYKTNFHVTPNDNLVLYKGRVYLSLTKRGILTFTVKSPGKKTNIQIQGEDKSGKLTVSKKYGITHHNGNIVRFILNGKLIDHPELKDRNQITFFREDDLGRSMYIEKYKTINAYFNKNELSFLFGSEENYQYRTMCKVSESCLLLGSNQGIIKINKNPALIEKISDSQLIKESLIVVRRTILENRDKRYFLSYPYIFEQDSTLSILSNRIFPVADGVLLGNELFFATDGNGLQSVNVKTKKHTSHICKEIRWNESFEDISVFSDSLLLLTSGNKFVFYNVYTNKGKAYYLKEGTTIHVALCRLNSRIIHFGTNKGLVKVELSQGLVKKTMHISHTFHLNVRDVLERRTKNEIWLATDIGVVVLNSMDGKIIHSYTNEQQVSHPRVVELVEDKNNCVWASTYSGLTVYNTANQMIYFVNKNHGLHNTEFNYKSACVLKNGKIIFGGLNCYEAIEPGALFQYHYASTFWITGVEILKNKESHNFTTYNSRTPITFNTGKESLKIYLSNFDFQYGDGYTFQYSLDSKNWYKVEKNNCIILTNLSYGKYQLKIRMFNPFGQLVKQKTFQLLAFTPIYSRTEFVIIITLLVLLFGAMFVRYFIRSIRIKSQIKSQIAMDLHDESGTILTRLLLMSRKEKFEEKDNERLQAGLKEALYSFRTYLDSISRKKHALQQLIDEIKEFVILACSETAISPNITMVLDQNHPIKADLFRDIKLIAYETVTNSIKHSNATQLFIDLSVKNKLLHLVISDSGSCDMKNLDAMRGNGIGNIKKRVRRNNGIVLFYLTKETQGLTIDIKIPLK